MPKTGDRGFGLGGRHGLPRSSKYVAPVVIVAPPPPPPTLNDLTFSGLTFAEGAAAGTAIGNISGKYAGSVLTISPNDGRVVFNGPQTALLVGLTASSDGTINYTIRETDPVSGVYHDTALSIVVTNTDPVDPGDPDPVLDTLDVVGPHANWIASPAGAAGTGRGPVAATARTTAKPRLHWWTVPSETFVGKRLVGVFASAKGGISKVQFSGDIATTDVTERKLIMIPDANGNPEPFDGYFILVDEALFTSHHANGEIHIYAEAFPNDGTMQTRVIGGNGTGTNWTPNEAYEMNLFPRSTKYTWEKTIGTGGDYANFDAFVQGLKDHAAAVSTEIRPHGTFISNATYEVTNAHSPENGGSVSEHVGYCEMDAAPGVTVVFNKATFDPENTAVSWGTAWNGWFGIEQLKWSGSGIQFDQRHWWDYRSETHRRTWFNGCRIFNSAGTDNLIEINGSPTPGFSTSTMGDGVSNNPIVTNVRLDYADAFGGGTWMLRGLVSNRPGVGRQVFTRFMANNRVIGATARWWRLPTQRVRMSLKWTGTGEGVAKIYGDASGDTRVELWNGPDPETLSLTSTYHINRALAYHPGEINTFTELVGAITGDAAAAGWEAVQVGDDTTDLWPRYLGNEGAGADEYICTGLAQNIACQNWIHSEWAQFFGDSSILENYVFLRNINVANFYATGIMNTGGGRDVEMSCNIFDRYGATDDRNSGSSWSNHHVSAFDNVFGQGIAWYDQGDREYNESGGNILNSTPGDVLDELYFDNITVGAITSSNAGSTGNVSIGGEGAFMDLFANRADGLDYRPAATGVLRDNLRALGPRSKWDINGKLKDPDSDTVGPLGVLSDPIPYPFDTSIESLPVNNLPDSPPVSGVDGPIVGQRWNVAASNSWGGVGNGAVFSNNNRTVLSTGAGARVVGIANINAKVYQEMHIDTRAAGDWIWVGIANSTGNTYIGNDGGKGAAITHFGKVVDSDTGFGAGETHQIFPGGSAGGPLFFDTGDTVGIYVDRANKKMWWTTDGVTFYGALGYTDPHPDIPASGWDITAVLDQDIQFYPEVFCGTGTQITATFYEDTGISFALPVVTSYSGS